MGQNGLADLNKRNDSSVMSRLEAILTMADNISNLAQSTDVIMYGSGTAAIRAGVSADNVSGYLDAIGQSLEDTEQLIRAIYARLVEN